MRPASRAPDNIGVEITETAVRSSWIKMSREEWRAYFALSHLSWGVTALVMLATVATVLMSPLKFSGALIPPEAVIGLGFGILFLFYANVRKDPFIVILSNGIALSATFRIVAGFFSYTAQFWGRAFPLRDAVLARADQGLGFDWVASLVWQNQHPLLAELLNSAYSSPVFQFVALLAAQFVFTSVRRFQLLILSSQMAALATSLLAGLLPALGAYSFFKVTPGVHQGIALATMNQHVADILSLRGADPVLPFEAIQGIVTFPSYHAALGVLLIWAAWPHPVLRWISIVLNLALITATPLSGAHYIVDVIAGFCVACLALWVATTVARKIDVREGVLAQSQPVGILA